MSPLLALSRRILIGFSRQLTYANKNWSTKHQYLLDKTFLHPSNNRKDWTITHHNHRGKEHQLKIRKFICILNDSCIIIWDTFESHCWDLCYYSVFYEMLNCDFWVNFSEFWAVNFSPDSFLPQSGTTIFAALRLKELNAKLAMTITRPQSCILVKWIGFYERTFCLDYFRMHENLHQMCHIQ